RAVLAAVLRLRTRPRARSRERHADGARDVHGHHGQQAARGVHRLLEAAPTAAVRLLPPDPLGALMSLYPNGLGENGVGDVLASAAPIQCGPANIIWWVSSTSPNALDAASPRGSDREEPLATLAQAI